jgi:purine-binding chemotaxis protein CheW
MDILAARKKAAEQASARTKPEPAATVPAAQPVQNQAAPPVSAETHTDGRVGSPAAVSAAPVKEESPNTTGIIPASSAGEAEETRQQEIELLSFRLGGEEYAVMVEDVREVLKVVQLTMVPNTPDYILGVTSLRGTMLPIIDLCKRFGLAPGAKDEKSRIVVVSSFNEYVGLLVDRVTGVFRILPEEIKQAPENVEQGAEFLRGIVRKGDRLYILLDLDKAVGT